MKGILRYFLLSGRERLYMFIPIVVVPRFAAGSFERLQLFDKMVKLASWAGNHLDALP